LATIKRNCFVQPNKPGIDMWQMIVFDCPEEVGDNEDDYIASGGKGS